MYGAGNIGRGFIGKTFSDSGYEVVFIDINSTVIDRLNADREYPVTIAAAEGYYDEEVQHVRGVNGMNMEELAEEIATADVMATAVGVNILPRVAAPIAKGLELRWQRGVENPLNIIICENMLDADRYMEKLQG